MKGKKVTFSFKKNGQYYKECDLCRKHTDDTNPKVFDDTNYRNKDYQNLENSATYVQKHMD